jgi:hypothetical protein
MGYLSGIAPESHLSAPRDAGIRGKGDIQSGIECSVFRKEEEPSDGVGQFVVGPAAAHYQMRER